MDCCRTLLIRWTTTTTITIIFTTATLLMATTSALAMPHKTVVVVSGAGGQTGQFLFRKLLARPEEFTPFGIVRSVESKQALVESGGVPEGNVLVADVTNAKAVQEAVQTAIFCSGGDNRRWRRQGRLVVVCLLHLYVGQACPLHQGGKSRNGASRLFLSKWRPRNRRLDWTKESNRCLSPRSSCGDMLHNGWDQPRPST